jgi:TRAP transporter TAXI family solute receptor
MRRFVLLGLAAGLAVLAGTLVAYQWVALPTTLRVAVGPIGGEDTRLVVAAAQYLARERSGTRLKLVLTDGVATASETIDKGTADLAVVRTDVAMPERGQTVAILHRDAALLVTTARLGLGKVADLQGRHVGVLRRMAANEALLDTILHHYDVPAASVGRVMLNTPTEAVEALSGGRVDAVLIVGDITGRMVTDTVAALARSEGASLVFLPVGEADAIAQRDPRLESYEIVRGAFGGVPSRPAETLTTIAVTHRLVARNTVDDDDIAEFTRLLFAMRPAITGEAPLAGRIEPADTEKGSSLPVHPGAAAYYEGEVQTFMERYGDWFYLMVMALSIVGSAMAALAGAAASRTRARTMSQLNELLSIVREARATESALELDRLERTADEVLATALAKVGQAGVDETALVAFTLALDQARRAIAERRLALEIRPVAVPCAAE